MSKMDDVFGGLPDEPTSATTPAARPVDPRNPGEKADTPAVNPIEFQPPSTADVPGVERTAELIDDVSDSIETSGDTRTGTASDALPATNAGSQEVDPLAVAQAKREKLAKERDGKLTGSAIVTILMLGTLGSALTFVGGAFSFDAYGPTVESSSVITSRSRQEYTCTRTVNGRTQRRTCIDYDLGGFLNGTSKWNVDDKTAYERFARGTDVSVERSRITQRVVSINEVNGNDTWSASGDWSDRLLWVGMLAVGVFGLWLSLPDLWRLASRPVAILGGTALLLIPAGIASLFVVKPIEAPSTAAVIEATDEPITTNAPTTKAPTTTAPPTTQAPTTTAPPTTEATTTTAPPSPDEDLQALFESAVAGRAVVEEPVVWETDRGTIEALVERPETWTVDRRENALLRLEFIQPEAEMIDKQLFEDTYALTIRRNFDDSFEAFVMDEIAEDPDATVIFDETSDGRARAIVRTMVNTSTRWMAFIDAEPWVLTFDEFAKRDDQSVELMFAAAKSVQVISIEPADS